MSNELPPETKKAPTFFDGAFPGLILLAASLAASFYLMYSSNRIPAEFPALAGLLVGGAVLPFILAWVASRVIKGSVGLVLGIIVVILITTVVGGR